jgi:hypothetical protein
MSDLTTETKPLAEKQVQATTDLLAQNHAKEQELTRIDADREQRNIQVKTDIVSRLGVSPEKADQMILQGVRSPEEAAELLKKELETLVA